MGLVCTNWLSCHLIDPLDEEIDNIFNEKWIGPSARPNYNLIGSVDQEVENIFVVDGLDLMRDPVTI